MARPANPGHGAQTWDSYLESVFDDLYAKLGTGVFVSPTAPVVEPGQSYIWVQTGLGSGDDMTIWIEDGT